MSFSTLGLSLQLTKALEALGFSEPTAVQRAVVPAALDKRDLFINAKTGSGKTLAYLLPLLSQLNERQGSTILILVPTRELVAQLMAVVESFSSHLKPFRCVPLSGGSSINPQLMALRGGVDLVLATPGRLLDVMRKNAINPDSIDVLVLDEADRLLDDGFQSETSAVLDQLSAKQTIMVSATFSKSINARAKWMLKNPLEVRWVQPVSGIEHNKVDVDAARRDDLMSHLLTQHLTLPLLVFVADRISAEQLSRRISAWGYLCEALHGRQSMHKRHAVLNRLRDGKLQVMVATDLAARGLDIPFLPTVINYDLPRSADLYVHRAGRTGRAGESGHVFSLVDTDSEPHWHLIARRTGILAHAIEFDGFERVVQASRAVSPSTGNGGIKGRRMSKKDKLRAAAKTQVKPSDSSP